MLQSENPREKPWCFYLDNEYGNLVCIFDPGNVASAILRILKHLLYPDIPQMMIAGDANARSPNEVGMEMVIKRQEVWMKYYSESYDLLSRHFEHVNAGLTRIRPAALRYSKNERTTASLNE